MVLSQPRRKTVTLTIRIEQRVEESLREDAAYQKISINSLVSQLLTDHAEFGRHAEKFGSIRIPAEGFARLLRYMNDESLAEAAREIAAFRVRTLMPIWYDAVTPETILDFLMFWLEHTRTARIAFTEKETPRRVVGFHHLGAKFSLFLKHTIEAMFQMAGKKIVVDMQENQISFSIH